MHYGFTNIFLLYLHTRTEQNGFMVIDFKIKTNSEVPKYQQLVNAINDELANNNLSSGDALPSVNQMCGKLQLSRDTVFKAYSILKEQAVIESVPNKGYYIANKTRKVLLVLDTFKAYKEVLYHSFVNNLPDNIITDVQFHHYNIENFKTILNNSKGKYFKYVVMSFDNREVSHVLADIPDSKLLLIDWNINSKADNNFVFQDFGKAFYKCLKEATPAFSKYEKLIFLYPSFTNHTSETISYFKKYCEEETIDFEIITDPGDFNIKKYEAYISVSDRMLGNFLEQCRTKNLEPGTDVGFLSYNETPMKQFIYKGISVISTDFKQMGAQAAEFITNDNQIQSYIPTQLILRDSL
ncbi:GntR family transcriptional regulator [Algibacter sp. 2305UL17-15]|uniref:GntR family transcriptional regulator n=1 Tax=Algibacter sp. 2305UL17-15 TaxID=3231268 RepID=UPI003458931E